MKLFCIDIQRHRQSYKNVLCLIGRDETTSSTCCVTVTDPRWILYVVLNPHIDETNTVYIREVEGCVRQYMVQSGIRFSMEVVKRRLITSGEEHTCLLVSYDSSRPIQSLQLRHDAVHSVVFTGNDLVENFIVGKGVRLPCWVDVSVHNDVLVEKRLTWCKSEVVSLGEHVTVDSTKTDVMPLCLASIHFISKSSDDQEIHTVCISVASTTPEVNKETNMNIPWMTNIPCLSFPSSIAQETTVQVVTTTQSVVPMDVIRTESETKLIDVVTDILRSHDPDICIGYDVVNSFRHLEKRCTKRQILRIGRIKTDSLTNCGRLLMDPRQCVSEYMKDGNNHSLSLMSLVNRHLVSTGKQSETLHSLELFDYMWAQSKDECFQRVLHYTSTATRCLMELCIRNHFLTVSSLMSRICGCTWQITMKRSGPIRAAYLLLHEFTRRGFLVPFQSEVSRTQDHTSYSGGLNLDPTTGLHNCNCVMFDFRSLFPSIVVEFKLCVSNTSAWSDLVPKSKEQVEDASIITLAKQRVEQEDSPPTVPYVLEHMVRARKDLSESPGSFASNLRLALKLVSNTLYGSFAFPQFRFYSLSLATVIAFLSRCLLLFVRDRIEEKRKLPVIYGDTDSLLVKMNSVSIQEARLISREIITDVNSIFKFVRLNKSREFKRLIIFKKKRYLGWAIDETTQAVVKEAKGLETVRGDYCTFVKDYASRMLDCMLCDVDPHSVMFQLIRLLSSIPKPDSVDDFVSFVELSQDPSEYTQPEKDAHVQVALQMRAIGINVAVGSEIPFVICKGTSKNAADRAYHPSIVKMTTTLSVDFEYYLAQIKGLAKRFCEIYPSPFFERMIHQLHEYNIDHKDTPSLSLRKEEITTASEPLFIW